MPRRNVNHAPRGGSAAREIGPDDPTIDAPIVTPEAANDQQGAEVIELTDAMRSANQSPEARAETPEAVVELTEDNIESFDWSDTSERRRHEIDALVHNEQRAAQQQAEQRAKVKAEFAQMQRSEALGAASKYDAHRQKQAVELRRREVKLQNDISALGFFDFRKKRELKRQLAITTERLNGLTQSTPEMRRLQRRQETVQTVGGAIPGARMNAEQRLHHAGKQKESLGYRVAKFFGFGKRKGRIDAQAYRATIDYADETYQRRGEVHIPDDEMQKLFSERSRQKIRQAEQRKRRRQESRDRRDAA